MDKGLIGDVLSKVQKSYESYGFSRFEEVKKNVSAMLQLDYPGKTEEIIYILELCERELKKRNSCGANSRIFSIDDRLKKDLERLVKRD